MMAVVRAGTERYHFSCTLEIESALYFTLFCTEIRIQRSFHSSSDPYDRILFGLRISHCFVFAFVGIVIGSCPYVCIAVYFFYTPLLLLILYYTFYIQFIYLVYVTFFIVELSEVLWHMIMMMAFKFSGFAGSVVVYAIFFAFGSLTLCVLVVMEGLSAFLHALRLHW